MRCTVALCSIAVGCGASAFVVLDGPGRGPTAVSTHRRPTFVALKESRASELWKVERVDHVSDWIGSTKTYPNPLSLKDNVPSSWFVGLNDAVAAKVQINALETVDSEEHWSGLNAEAFILAGPRAEIAFDPKGCKAAIVTCGGLCPGLNSVVREVVMCLRRQYGVTETYGIPAGYRGFLDPDTWRSLDEEAVKNLHNQGGSILGSSRGGHDTSKIVDSLVEQGVNLLFVVGGDGTVRGAAKIADEVKSRKLPIAVAVVPKTIDNDVPLLDRTFGFETAVEAAREAINVANTEAEGFPHGLGVVKVMGRNRYVWQMTFVIRNCNHAHICVSLSGFIAMHSALGSCVADLCLVPEVDFHLDDIVDHLYDRIVANDKAVVVVAEGAGQTLMAEMGAAGEAVKDASGNVLLDDIGPWLCKQLKVSTSCSASASSKRHAKLLLSVFFFLHGTTEEIRRPSKRVIRAW